jgi:hypothetical protein
MRRSLLAFLVIGCGEVHFVEPYPPQLFRSKVQFTAMSIAEPVAWMTILDLFIEDADACASARQTTLAAVRVAVASLGGNQLELAAQDLAPDCRVRGRQPLDIAAVQGELAAAQAAFPGANVRPVIFYIDNFDLTLPPPIAAEVASARTLQPGQPAILWPISLPSVATQLNAERTTDWTYAGDPDLSTRLTTSLLTYLPLQTTASVTSGPVPLLDAAELETTREFKVCALPKDTNIEDPPAIGATAIVDRAHPPTITFDLPQNVAVPKFLFPTEPMTVLVEGCTGNCDRYFIREPGDAPRPWDLMTACALGYR